MKDEPAAAMWVEAINSVLKTIKKKWLILLILFILFLILLIKIIFIKIII